MKRRFIAWILTLAMITSVIPMGVTVSAVDESTVTVTQWDTKTNTNQDGGIIYTKTSTAKSDGTVDITLTAHTTGQVKQTMTVSPTDIVLVLDVSGSMDEDYESSNFAGYEAVKGEEYTYYTIVVIFPVSRDGYGMDNDNNSRQYYINTGTDAEPVATKVTYVERDSNGFEVYRYTSGGQYVYVYPELEEGQYPAREHTNYPVVQFYQKTKMSELKAAVNAFIDTTASMNTGLAADQMHNISIVKFASNSYYDSVEGTVVENATTVPGNNRGAGNNSSYNYSQVVLGLTPVDTNGVVTLKNAVASLQPGGATAVDYGLKLAEQVILERNQVAAASMTTVDRKEVVIVFTDGSPTHSDGFSQTVANTAISTAGQLESHLDIEVYGICIDETADASDIERNLNKFMHSMSSNFPEATSMSDMGENGSVDNGYYMTPDGSTSLTSMFEVISQHIDHPTIELGEEATVVDTLSPYFNFENASPTSVVLQTALRKADGTWADPVVDNTLECEIKDDVLTVKGFDFDANYVSENGRGENKDFYGKQLVVSFTVIPDYDVIDAASVTLNDGVIPTNTGFATLVDSALAPVAEIETPELDAHQVVYKLNGNEYASYNRFTGSDVTVDANPTREGYTFSGWSTDDVQLSGDDFTMPKHDVEFTGSFTVNKHNVKYVLSGVIPTGIPTLPTSVDYDYGTEVTVDTTFVVGQTYNGYTFDGWQPLNTELVVSGGKFSMPDYDVVLRGTFSKGVTHYTVEQYFETIEGGSYTKGETDTKTAVTDETVTVSATHHDGFTFDENNENNKLSGIVEGDGSLVLKIYYKRNEFDVTYSFTGDVPEGVAAPVKTTHKYGKQVFVEGNPSVDGYDFSGWTSLSTTAKAGESFTMPNHAVAFVGEFTARNDTGYKAEYYLENLDGDFVLNDEASYNQTATTGTSVSAIHKTFTGYTFDTDNADNKLSGIVAGDGSLVLKLYYTLNTYTLDYAFDITPPEQVTLPVQETYKYGETVIVADDLELEGYTFNGWHSSGYTVTDDTASFTMPGRNVTLYGSFEPKAGIEWAEEHYFPDLDGNYPAEPTYKFNHTGTTGETVSATVIKEAEGFVFDADHPNNVTEDTVASDGSTVLKLYYERLSYNVSYIYDPAEQPDGAPELPATVSYKYGADVTVEDELTLAGYLFEGWTPQQSGVVASGSFTMPAHDVVYEGNFIPSTDTKYSVEYYLESFDGDFVLNDEASYNETATTGTSVSAIHKTFTGYTFDADNADNKLSGIVAGDGSLVLKLYYNINSYTVSYDFEVTPPEHVALPGDETYYYGQEVTVADDLELEGYTFNGWHSSGYAIDNDTSSFTMPDRDVTLYGSFEAMDGIDWAEEHYFQNLDGSYPTTPSRRFGHVGKTGDSVVAVAIKDVEGFVFDEDNVNNNVSDTINGDGSTVLKFYYERLSYNVSYIYDPAEQPTGAPGLPATVSYKYGADVTVEDELTLVGYLFDGWTPQQSGVVAIGSFTMPAHDVVYEGNFIPNADTGYKVEYYLENFDGDFVLNDEASYNQTATTGTSVSAIHKTFTGYTFDTDNADNKLSGIVAGDGSLVLKLYYNINSHTVKYAFEVTPPEQVALPATASYKYGETVTIAGDPQLTGYTFNGWHSSGHMIDNDTSSFTMPDREVTLYGSFEPKNTDWAEEHYFQNLDGSYPTAPSRRLEHTGKTGDSVSAVAIKEAEGFIFDEDNANNNVSDTINGDGSTVLKFYYERLSYNVSYIYDPAEQPDGAATLPAMASYKYGEEVQVSATPTLTGYDFVGWYPEQTGIPTSGKFNMPAYDVVFEGDFEPRNDTVYKVYHHLQKADGSYPESVGAEYISTHTGTTGTLVTAKPRVFDGYKYDDTIHGTVKTGTVAGNGSLVLHLFYSREEFTVTYVLTSSIPVGGQNAPVDANSYRHGATVEIKPVLTAPLGYKFVGWTPVAHGGETITIENGEFAMPKHNVRLEGKYFAENNIPYKIIHWAQNTSLDGYEVYSSDARVGTTDTQITVYPLIIPGFTDVTNYIVDGQQTVTINGDGSTVINFYYNRNTHKITYKYEGKAPNGAPSVPTEINNVPYGKQITVAPKPKLPGYTFNGWKTTDAQISDDSFTMPDKNVVLKGSFTSNIVDYEVKYWLQNLDDDNYTLDHQYTDSAYVGQLVVANANSYQGFVPNAGASKWEGYVSVDENGIGNLVLNLYYDRRTFNVTYGYYDQAPYNAPDLTEKNLIGVRYGAEVQVSDKPSMTGYAFDGWYTHTAIVEDGRFTMPNHDVSFLGRWTTQFLVKYELNGGVGATGVDYSDEYVNAGSQISVKTAPTREGYYFNGWKEGTTDYAPASLVKVDKNMTFIAKWQRIGGGEPTANYYTLSYVTNGGNAIASERHKEGTRVQLIKVPEKEGYVFEGWYADEALEESVTSVTMNENKKVYAAWVEDNGNAGHGHETPDQLNGEDHIAYVLGYPDGTVKPNENITRAEVTAIFFRLLKPDLVRDQNFTTENSFTDVNKGHWFNNPVSTMARLGIVNGRTLGVFAPDAKITRAEFAVICARFDNSEYEVAHTFNDVEGHWAKDEIYEAAAHGWVRGYEDGSFGPDKFITRAEAITMINRVLNRVPETVDDLIDGMKVWPDNNDKSAWYYIAVQEATNSHDYEKKNHVYETWTKLNEATDWTKYERTEE